MPNSNDSRNPRSAEARVAFAVDEFLAAEVGCAPEDELELLKAHADLAGLSLESFADLLGVSLCRVWMVARGGDGRVRDLDPPEV